MHLVEINVISLQAMQAVLNCSTNVFAGQTTLIWSPPHRPPTLRCQHDLIAFSFEPFPNNLLGATNGIETTTNRVHIRRVKEIHSHFNCRVHDRKAHRLVTLPTESHGS